MTRLISTVPGALNPTRLTSLVLVAACAILISASTASAQTNVALVDIGLIFKNHPEFSTQLDGLKKEAEQFQANMQDLQRQMMQKAEVLQQYTPGSAEFKAKESELAQESARIEVEQKDKMLKLMQREAQLHYSTYVEVKNSIQSYCEPRGIKLVLRYNSTPMEANNPNSIMQRVNGSVVYHLNQKDITNVIIQQLVQMKGQANRGGANLNR